MTFQSRKKTWLVIALAVVGAVGLWALYSDLANCRYRARVTISEQSSATQSPSPPVAQSGNGAVSIEDLDKDQDGLKDSEEDLLANRFAPIVYHGQCERNYPVSVDWLLSRASLCEYNVDAKIERIVSSKLSSQTELLNRAFTADQNGQQKIGSDSSYSLCKRSTYFLANVPRADQIGERDNPKDWVTYVHTYTNQRGGVTIQYWRCYSYNAASFLSIDFSHGGDWEAIAVHLDSALKPEFVAFLGHNDIEYYTSKVQWEGDHPKVWSEEGGHASLPDSSGMKSKRFTRQETWKGGQVIWWDGTPVGEGGGLLNVGEKGRPRNGQMFVQYSGLWGSPGRLFITSGYWGPAFNETGATCANGEKAYKRSAGCSVDAARCGRIFHKAWCDGMDARSLDINRECYASRSAP